MILLFNAVNLFVRSEDVHLFLAHVRNNLDFIEDVVFIDLVGLVQLRANVEELAKFEGNLGIFDINA